MKILYLVHQFYPEYRTGTEKFIFNLSSMMQKYGYNVTVLTYSFYDDSYYDKTINNILLKEFVYKGIRILAVKHKNIPQYLNIETFDRDLYVAGSFILEDEHFDLIHVGHPMRVTPLISLAIERRIPYIITCTDFWLICPKINLVDSSNNLCLGPKNGIVCSRNCPELSDTFKKARLRITREIILKSRLVSFPSQFVASIFKNEIPQIINYCVIPHGINYNSILEKEVIYNESKKIIFGYAGSLNYHKGVHILITAFKKIKSNKVSLKIYGDSYNNIEYYNYIKKLAANDQRIEFCGPYLEDDVGEVLNNLDVLIIPSICYETYSFVFHEALACLIPVIASNIGVMAEKIIDGVNGFTFQVGNVDSLYEKLKLILENPTLLNKVKKNIEEYLPPRIEEEAYIYIRSYEESGVF